MIAILSIGFSSLAGAAVCDVDNEDDFNLICTEYRVTADIAITSLVFGIPEGAAVYGAQGTEIVSGNLNNGLFALMNNGITFRNIVITNSSAEASASAIIVGDSTTGNVIHDVEFQNCGNRCIYVFGSGAANLYSNTYTDTVPSQAIVYESPAFSAPVLVSGSLSTLDNWLLNMTTVTSGSAEAYGYSNGDLTPIGSINSNASGSFSVTIPISEKAPGGTFYALLTTTKTSEFGNGMNINAMDDSNFSWGSASACKTSTWFMDHTEGLGAGDYDGDTLTNAQEDANANCIVDTGETDPTLTDTDGDGVADNADNCPVFANPAQDQSDTCAVVNTETDTDGDGIADATDNCPAVANALQKDLDGDGTGNLCDSDFANLPPTASTLLSPDNGATGVSTEPAFRWNSTTDPENDAINYRLFLCEDESFGGCTTATHEVNPSLSINDGIIAGSMPIFIGAALIGVGAFGRNRKRILMMLIMLSAFAGVASCGGGGSDPVNTEITYSATGLKSATTYYWKVVAVDANENSTTSETRSFTTN